METALNRAPRRKSLAGLHPVIARLLQEDAQRQEAAQTAGYVLPWEKPRYQTGIERRRLKLVSSVLAVAAPFAGRAEAFSKDRYEATPVTTFMVTVGHQTVQLQARVVAGRKQSGRTAKAPTADAEHIAFSVGSGGGETTWTDGTRRLEDQVREIAIALTICGEEQHRADILHRYRWRVEARADLLERHRRALEAAEQKKRERLEKRERLAKLERQRVERLLGEADNLRKAETIRGYVTEVLKIKERTPAVGENDLRTWADWAPPRHRYCAHRRPNL